MVLYSAKVDDVAVPVNSNPDSEIQQEQKPKRKLSEKQLAAREERERAKQQKLAEKEAAKAERLAAKALAPKKPRGVSKKQAKPEQPVSPPPTSSAESVDVPAPIAPPTESPIEQDEPVLEPVPMKRTSKKVRDEDPNEPPAWFKTFIKNAKKEEAKASSVKRPSKQVEQEANEMAHQQWQDPYTRDRINNQANEHMRKMHNLYNQMFYK